MLAIHEVLTLPPPTLPERFLEGVKTTLYGMVVILTDIDNLNKVTELVFAALSILASTMETVTDILARVISFIRNMADLTDFIGIFKRIYDWCTPDDKGLMIWQRGWHVLAGIISQTVSNIFGALNFLNGMGAIALGAASTALGVVGNAFKIGYYVFDTVTKGCAIWETSQKINKIAQRTLAWQQVKQQGATRYLVPVQWRTFIAGKIAKLEAQPLTESRSQKLKEYRAVARATNKLDVERFIDAKIARNNTLIENHEISNKKAWINIAINVGNIVLMVFSIALVITCPVLAVTIVALSLTVVTFGVDIAGSLVATFLKHKPLPTIPLPQQIPTVRFHYPQVAA